MTALTARQAREARKLTASVTRGPERVKDAQRLRYQVFSEEYNCNLGAATPGIDADRFDPWCEHLMVTDEASGQLVATTRILHQRDLTNTGGFYSASEFDLANLTGLSGNIAELGRTCVHPDYRTGATISLLWSELAAYLIREQVDYLIGCASISMADGGHKAWRIAEHLRQTYLTPEHQRVTPHRALPHITPGSLSDRPVQIPPLIKAYMRLGARICGEPCWDPDFRCADLLVLLEVQALADRYSRHFIQRRAAE